ncbi:MAG: hypothetical protein IT285_08990 [Bdellovibrionales bacterium]|nr:hypothetical protein [Bdellovibrionales bacterium]
MRIAALIALALLTGCGTGVGTGFPLLLFSDDFSRSDGQGLGSNYLVNTDQGGTATIDQASALLVGTGNAIFAQVGTQFDYAGVSSSIVFWTDGGSWPENSIAGLYLRSTDAGNASVGLMCAVSFNGTDTVVVWGLDAGLTPLPPIVSGVLASGSRIQVQMSHTREEFRCSAHIGETLVEETINLEAEGYTLNEQAYAGFAVNDKASGFLRADEFRIYQIEGD